MRHHSKSWPTIGLLTGAAAWPSSRRCPRLSTAHGGQHHAGPLPGGYTNLVVIYEENHSFDNLYGQWGRVGGRVVDGLQNAGAHHDPGGPGRHAVPLPPAERRQPHLAVPPPDDVHRCRARGAGEPLRNSWLTVDDYIRPTDTTCPAPGVFAPNGVLNGTGLPGGCTRDIVHRFYQEQYQIDGGKQDRYVTGSDAVGLTMGRYATQSLPIYRYLHSKGAPNYVVADRFFQAAFGGSFLNHQYLIAARAPVDTGGATPTAAQLDHRQQRDADLLPALHRHVDGQGLPAHPGLQQRRGLRLHARPAATSPSTRCSRRAPRPVAGAKIPLIDDAVYPNIGDRMSDAGVSWNWYSGGWDDAAAGNPGPLFQFHHQPFNYFKNYAVGAPGPLAPPGRDEVLRRRQGGHPAPGVVRQALRRRERAPRLRERARRQRPPRRPAPDDHVRPAGQEDARRRDLRRVRRPVGPRLAAHRRQVGARAPASPRSSCRPAWSSPGSTARPTTRPPSWRRSSTASGCARSPPVTREPPTSPPRCGWATLAITDRMITDEPHEQPRDHPHGSSTTGSVRW